MEFTVKSIDEQLQVQDQAVLYQLRRSFHKIQELKEEIQKLKKDKDSQLTILSTLQKQLKQSKRQNSLLQSYNLDLVAQIESLTTKFKLVHKNGENQLLQSQLQVLKNRYLNCQQENTILRSQILSRQQQSKSFKDQMLLLAKINKQQEMKIQQMLNLTGQLRAQNLLIEDSNHILEALVKDHYLKEKQIQLLIQEYKKLLANLHKRLWQAQRGQELWFCQFSDLKDIVQQIEEARMNFKLRKLLKNQ